MWSGRITARVLEDVATLVELFAFVVQSKVPACVLDTAIRQNNAKGCTHAHGHVPFLRGTTQSDSVICPQPVSP